MFDHRAALAKWAEEQESIQEQIDEDTCDEHGVFCCPLCFDMETS